MKKIFYIYCLLFIGFQCFADTAKVGSLDSDNFIMINEEGMLDVEFSEELRFDTTKEISYILYKNEQSLYDCEITIKGNFDGNEIDIVVTIYDVTWAGCQTLKLAVKAFLAVN